LYSKSTSLCRVGHYAKKLTKKKKKKENFPLISFAHS